MNNIRALRLKMKLSQKSLADQLRLDQTTISKWEMGYSQPDIETAIKLSGIFNVSLDILFENPHRQILAQLPLHEAVFATRTYVLSHQFVPFSGIDSHASDLSENYFAVMVEHANMAPQIRPGSIAIVKKADQFVDQKLLFVCIGDNKGQLYKAFVTKGCRFLTSFDPDINRSL